MIIIGLGSNVGDRLENLRQALTAIKQIPTLKVQHVSPVYLSEAQLPEHAPADWNKVFFNCALSCECNLRPEELLTILQKIESMQGRDTQHAHWSPRVIDIDILAWHSHVIQSQRLTIPHPHLLERPFALWPLADVAPRWKIPGTNKTAEEDVEKWGSRYDGKAPFHTKQINQRIDTPKIVGIINVTPDSFSDGGKFADSDHAFKQAIQLLEAGAEILDIGAESTAPSSTAISVETEWQRLEPVLQAIIDAKKHMFMQPILSVDTRNAYVAEKALAMDIDWLNDVTGLTDPAMRDAVRHTNADCVVMHHMGVPPKRGVVIPRDKDPVEFLYDWSAKQIAMLEKDGITRDRIIIDPGIGFGKSTGQALEIFNHAQKFADLGVRVLIGHSRKSFMANFCQYPAPERDIETLAISMHLANYPVDYLRIHDVEMYARSLRVQRLLRA